MEIVKPKEKNHEHLQPSPELLAINQRVYGSVPDIGGEDLSPKKNQTLVVNGKEINSRELYKAY